MHAATDTTSFPLCGLSHCLNTNTDTLKVFQSVFCVVANLGTMLTVLRWPFKSVPQPEKLIWMFCCSMQETLLGICNYSLVPRLLPSFLSHTVLCPVCHKNLARSLGTRLNLTADRLLSVALAIRFVRIFCSSVMRTS